MMVEHQPTLAQVVEQHVYSPNAYLCSCRRDDDDAPTISFAEWAIHVEAVWRETCTITTVEQLDALPVGAVVHPGGCVYEKVTTENGDDEWWTDGQHDPNFDQRDLPATLLWLPEWGNK